MGVNGLLLAQVQLERMEKENVNLKYQNHIVSKELDVRSSEVVNGRRASELLTQQLANSAKKVTKLEEECNKLRTMVQKRPPSTPPKPFLWYSIVRIFLGCHLG